MMTPRSSCPGEECYSSPGRSYFRFSGESTLYLKDGRASRSLNLFLSPPWALRLLLQRCLPLKPVACWLRYVRQWHSPAEINQPEIENRCGARRHVNQYRWLHHSPLSRNRRVVHPGPAKVVAWSTAINIRVVTFEQPKMKERATPFLEGQHPWM